jgi:hypothetical protein
VGQLRVRDQPEDHRVEGVDLAAERPGEANLVDLIDAGVVHQQPDAGVQRGLRELDRPDVVLGDDDPGPAVGGAVVEDVRERPTVGDDALRRAARVPSTIPSGVMTPAR